MAKVFSDYVRKSLPFLGGEVELDVRALDKTEAPEFRRQTDKMHALWISESGKRENEDDETYRVRLSAVMEQIDLFMRDVFTRTKDTKSGPKGYYIRLVEPLENEDDDSRSIKDCETLFERGSTTFRFSVIVQIAQLADMDPFLGNSSGSPSTSTVAAGQAITGSPVTTTVDTVSPSPSTVTAETVRESFSLVV